MEGYEVIKERRIERGYTLKDFAELAGIVKTTLMYYENGTWDLRKLTLGRAIPIFRALELNIEDFFEEYYSVKSAMNEKIKKWHQEHPRILDREVLKGRIYDRCYKACMRSKAPAARRGALMDKCKDTMHILSNCKTQDGCIPEDIYKEYILPLQYEISMLDEKEHPNPVTSQIVEALYKSGLSQRDMCELCGVSVKNFAKYKNGSMGYHSMRIETALNLCVVLGLEFDKAFSSLQ